jgi:DNA polymerase/3'-5' exonuclease PolX
MDREEARVIGDFINEAVQRIIPGAEVQIMGSYRRGKHTCGDVDIHITHKKYQRDIPQNWCSLSRIVDLLWEQGRVLYHLTFLPEMKTGFTAREYMKSSRHIPEDAWGPAKTPGYMSNKGSRRSSYMGVFQSPIVQGRGRRVDIKFFPWRERIFATLYFTGNGFFNRSMRLSSARKYG